MFMLAIGNENLVRQLRKLPFSRKWLRVQMDRLNEFKDEEIIELAYRQFGMASGVTKQTHRGRFEELNDQTLHWLRAGGASNVHDIGVSSGITSVELHHAIRAAGLSTRVTVSDKFARFDIARGRFTRVIYDSDGVQLCTYLGPIYADDRVTRKYPPVLLAQPSHATPAAGCERLPSSRSIRSCLPKSTPA